MDKMKIQERENVSFLFVVDDTGAHARGMMAYGEPIRTSIACSDVRRAAVTSSRSTVRWMTVYGDESGEPEQHALVWHNACFSF